MNNGLFGFPPGKKITVDVQEFEADGIWYKPANAKFCFIEGSGGGQAGGAGTTTTHGSSGAAGVAFQVIEMASKFNQQEAVDIGAGSTNFSNAGGNTTFSNITWAGGVGAGACRNGYIGQNSSSQLTGGFGAGATTAGVAGRHGNFGAGGGGTGGTNAGTDGNAGGKPRTFQFAGSSAVTAETGGGAAGGLYALSVQNGYDANPLNDRHGFGEGGGGGAGNNAGGGARGGAGRRGSGGGGGGSGSTAGGQGGRGGDGFLRIQTYCWE